MRSTLKALLAASTGLALAASLAGCTANEPSKTDNTKAATKSEAPKADDKKADDKKADDKKADEKKDGEEPPAEGAVKENQRPAECGLQEQEGPEAKFGPYDGAIHYFQPGQMAPNPNSDPGMKMLDYKQSQMHLELDLKANVYGTNWGYSADETPANLRVVYKLVDSKGAELAKGRFMEMNAIDGSHYGTNLPKGTIKAPGDYKMTLTIYPPKNYDMHSDYITGVPAEKWFGPLTQTMDWKISKKQLDIVTKNTVEDFMNPSDKCKKYPKKLYKSPEDEKALKAAEANKPLPLK